MKRLEGPDFDPFRVPFSPIHVTINPDVLQDHRNGAFIFPMVDEGLLLLPDGSEHATKHQIFLRVIASNGGGWDHVSVSTEVTRPVTSPAAGALVRCPTWAEMEWAKRLFFKDDEVAMQLHVSVRNHISIHPHVLHIWRPHGRKIPVPPKDYV